jgi:hypothetical protein
MLCSGDVWQLFSCKWVISFIPDSVDEASGELFPATASSRNSRGLKAKLQASENCGVDVGVGAGAVGSGEGAGSGVGVGSGGLKIVRMADLGLPKTALPGSVRLRFTVLSLLAVLRIGTLKS